jgi:hypothetical protein
VVLHLNTHESLGINDSSSKHIVFDSNIAVVSSVGLESSINVGILKSIMMVSYESTSLVLKTDSWIKPITRAKEPSKRTIMDFGQ